MIVDIIKRTALIEIKLGPSGQTGPQGNQGLQGLKGDKGDTGNQGPAGAEATPITSIQDDGNGNLTIYTDGASYGPFALKGPQGDVGSQGPQGDQGSQGQQGTAGTNATPITSITDDGTGNLTIHTAEASYGPFYLKGPQGNEGPQGPQGGQGEQGPAGVEATPITSILDDGSGNLTIYTASASYGPFALKGPQGNQGANGADGGTGPQGDPGPPGTTSWTGLTDVPSTFPPETHTHAIADVTDLQTALDSKLPLSGGNLTGALTLVGTALFVNDTNARNAQLHNNRLEFENNDEDWSVSLYMQSSTPRGTSIALPSSSGTLLNDVSSLAAANLTGTVATARLGSGTASASTYLRGNNTWAALPTEIQVACSDETTALTAGTNKITFRMPYAMTLTQVRASVTTAPTGSTLIVDINEGGTSILSTKLSIDAAEKTSITAATLPVIGDSALANDAEITIDIDQVGSTVAGAGLKVTLIGTRA
jgi:hypothetical protein